MSDSKEPTGEEPMKDPLVQYLVVRKDLNWPLGALMAQACHAAVAAVWQHKEDPQVLDYMADIDRMHKVVLEAKDEGQLHKISEKLTANNVRHKLWVEQPENYPTCLATKPYPRTLLKGVMKGLRLLK